MKALLLSLLLLIPAIAFSATIYGDIYGPSLERIPAVIEVNTTPPTRIVANVSYSLSLGNGTYSIRAFSLDKEYVYEDSITISGNSSTRFDIILLPSLEPMDVPELDVSMGNGRGLPAGFLALGISVLLLVAGSYSVFARFLMQRKQTPSLDDHARKAVEILSREGRMLQKDLRRELGLSEAKVSMIVAELEEAGIVKKIRKGRANIVVFKSKA